MIENSDEVNRRKDQLYSNLVSNNKEGNMFEKYIKDYNILLRKYLQLGATYEKSEIEEVCFGDLYNEKYSEIELGISFFKNSLKTKGFSDKEKSNLLKRELMNIFRILEEENKNLCNEKRTLKMTENSSLTSIKQLEEMCGIQENEIFELQGWNDGLKQENQSIKDALNN